MTIIDDIKARVDLMELIQQDASVRLRKSGKNWTGFCPFHANTHTPALVVFPDTQTWSCFGCHRGGTVIDWMLEKNRGWDVKEAIRELARIGQIPMGNVDGTELKQRLAVRVREDALTIAARVFAKWLLEDEEALAYARSRGWTDETIAASRLGFSGRATTAQVQEMRGEFDLHGIPMDSPEAVMIFGFKGDVAAWAQKHGLDPRSFNENSIHGMMEKPGLVYAHKLGGRIVYLSRRHLPGQDVRRDRETGEEREWKSFNGYAALAGEKIPYFNHMHLRDRSRIVIVEGQGDAITLGQWGIPAMALCGSSWKNLGEYIEMLQARDGERKPKYEAVYFATDADTPGEAVVIGTGRDEGTFPLTTAFGPMLWVARWPKFKWARADGHEKVSKDANDLAMYFADEKVTPEVQEESIRAVFDRAEPIVLLAAQWAGRKQGAERTKMLEIVLPLIAKMPPNARNDFRLKLAKALYPEDLFPEYKGAPLRPFNKLIGDELKKSGDDENPVEIEETLGGWYPVNEDGTEGYLIEELYDLRTGKAQFAYAHIWLNGKVTREIGIAKQIDINGKRLVPWMDDNIRFGTVRLPSELGMKKSIRELLAEIRLFIERYFLIDDQVHIILIGLYALFTWLYDAFPYSSFLYARGPAGSGKSELMLLVGRICYRMMITAGLTSIAGWKGMAHLYKGTLMIDEVDRALKRGSQDERGELQALLNVRAMREQARIITMMDVLKADGTHTFRPTTTFVFGPTLMTGYKPFPDPATESRCLPFDLYKRSTEELLTHYPPIEPGRIPKSLDREAMQLVNQLLFFRLSTWLPDLEVEDSVMLTDTRISARMNQVMRPLKVLAHLLDDKDLMKDLEMVAQINFDAEQTRESESFEAMIFRAVLAVYEDETYAKYIQTGKLGQFGNCKYVLAKDLASIVNEIMDAENFANPDQKKKGEGVTSKTVSSICKDIFRLPTARSGSKGGGVGIVLDPGKIAAGKFRFGMDKEMSEKHNETRQIELAKAHEDHEDV